MKFSISKNTFLLAILLFSVSACLAITKGEYAASLKENSAKKPAQQISNIKNLLEGNPDFSEPYLKLVQLYWSINQPDSVLVFFENNAENESAQYALIWHYLYKSQIDKAISLFGDKFHQDRRYVIINELARQLSRTSISQEIRFKLQNILSSDEFGLLFNLIFFHNREYDRFLSKKSSLPDSPAIEDNLGLALLETGKRDQARSVFQQAFEKATMAGDVGNIARFQLRLARIFAAERQYSRAFALLEENSGLVPLVWDMRLLYECKALYGLVNFNLGKHKESIEASQQSIKIAEQLNDHFPLISIYYNLGRAASLSEKYQLAFNAYKSSETYATEFDEISRLFRIQVSKTSLLFNLSLYSLADIFSQDAIQLALMTENQNFIRMAQGRSAAIQFGQENFKGAVEETKNVIQAEKVLSIVEKAYWYNLIGRSYMSLAQFDSAQIYLKEAYDFIRQTPQSSYYEGYYFTSLIELEIQRGNFIAAKKLLDQVDINFTERGDTELEVGHLLNLGLVSENLGDIGSAISTLRKGIKVAESSQTDLSISEFRIGYLSKVHHLYESLARIYNTKYLQTLNSTFVDSVFFFEEMSKSRVLKDALFHKSKKSHHLHSDSYTEAEQDLSQKQLFIRNTSTRHRSPDEWVDVIADIEFSKINLLQQKLISQPQFDETNKKDQGPPSLKQVRKKLAKNDLGLVLYHTDKFKNFALVATPDSVVTIPLQFDINEIQTKIDSLISPFHKISGRKAKQTVYHAGTAYSLYKQLVEPIESAIELPQTLLIIPGFNLTNLPFDLLLTKPPQQSKYLPTETPVYADNFLLNRYTVFYSPTSLILEQEKKRSNHSMAVFANPFSSTIENYDPELTLRERTGWSFMPLPFADKEADQIKKIYGKAQVFKKLQATEGELRSLVEDYDILHIASHAFVDTMFDDFSGLILAVGDSSKEDGILMGYEIKDLNIDCDLVALSACETGRGGKIQGEGVLGMPRLFLSAGARTILMSMWKVDDRFTSQLIPKFYEYYLKKNYSKAASLAMAKRDMLKTKSPYMDLYYQHPMFWASFAIYGDPGGAQDQSFQIVKYFWKILIAFLIAAVIIFFNRKRTANQ